MNVLLRSAYNVLKIEGPVSLGIETLRFLSMYYTPDKIAKYWLHKMAGTEWVMKEVQGSWMLLNLKEGGIHTDLYLNGIREPRATRYLQSILEPGWDVIDIGANIGYYTLQEGRKCSYTIALEPDPRNYEILSLNLLLNSYNITPYNLAAGDFDGKVGFEISHASNWRRISSRGDIKVEVTKLDSLFTGKFHYLRMDTEGYELNILQGAEGIIRDSRPGMFIEVHNSIFSNYGHTAKEFYEFLAKYDYSVEKSYIMAPTKEGPSGKIIDILKDKEAWKALVENSIASHVFFRR